MNQIIADYIAYVRNGPHEHCQWQKLLCDRVEEAFGAEDLRVDEEQLTRYLALQKHFPYRLMLWEEFCFCLHNCVYTPDGELRWPELVILVGRGAGKNGYLSFEDFALLTPVNGIPQYNIDIFAMSEKQARTSFDDIWNMLEDNAEKFKKYFDWTKEVIVNKKTRSELRFRAANAKTADGMKPGKVDNDEVHAYQDSRLMDVGKTGLGKKRHPRQTKISTMGNVRDGPLDHIIETGEQVLRGELPDNGVIYFFCRLDAPEEIDDERCWFKANPSLYDPARPQLLKQIRREYAAWKDDPVSNSDFATKRMNILLGNSETAVTDWENILAACAPIPGEEVLAGRPAVAGIDYASTQDFVAAGILTKVGQTWVWEHHSWVCLQSPSLFRIKFPYREAAARGECTLVDAPEIPPQMVAQWIAEKRRTRKIVMVGLDHYRYTMMARAFQDYGITPFPEGGILKLNRPSDQSLVAPIIASVFLQHQVAWGDDMMMRWYTNNACRRLDSKGNVTFEKIEPKSRKTDGFMAFVAAMVVANRPDVHLDVKPRPELPPVFVF